MRTKPAFLTPPILSFEAVRDKQQQKKRGNGNKERQGTTNYLPHSGETIGFHSGLEPHPLLTSFTWLSAAIYIFASFLSGGKGGGGTDAMRGGPRHNEPAQRKEPVMRRGLRALHLVDFRRFTSPKHALTHFVRLNASLGLTVSKAALTERFSRALARGVFLFLLFLFLLFSDHEMALLFPIRPPFAGDKCGSASAPSAENLRLTAPTHCLPLFSIYSRA